ncbi:MAG: putative dual-specificity RNA methyltransferase RlmN [Caldanaerobacter subterraneus]|uniref:Probable dual-specificity RNA methyltransferase RlmN n=4 Tax=Caldanaerobacter subterraneus TaxID=911092 RepID=RLMN_CALS4|nr:23S rRNA (adenine(2503)-C(2))-methyltransferase RlmN [Caldanaerobacter subterraneus]Q8R9T4.1 RecName: Full=Probable dual-specificity RNA methyltransferase RlmN; AltName: Full=23S rRNA (adenine(2503)-C(2))-methyltransferase; AltName: Full=23S rRNA m2A2503 methyltransferase; AltName: Full=Ribosomal RNA large subunit methyltransferase N; AltName: Full=tRNA (adenine(37)-C(2))-methyltransferase; AltName: Full=tRNA m2A37 methyltransferase [Caldanaerobacter subterraneus subsp. tengcongensis MB4]AAM24
MYNLKDMTLEEMEEFFVNLGESKFRAKQLYKWIYDKRVTDFDLMTDISKNLRAKLKEIAYISELKIIERRVSQIDDTVKYLFLLEDKNIIEGVAIKYKFGNTACVSTQVGCNMKCKFCASAIGGKVRDLKASEMVDQVMAIDSDYGKISNIVLMGSGEPFDNYDEVMKFIKIVNNPYGLKIGKRHITISTVGIVPKIYQFADEELQVNLSISLHAPNNELRNELMPINRAYPLEELMKACRYYIEKTNRRITFEYALIDGVNDKKEHAYQLVDLLKGMLCHVNLIPINYVKEIGFRKSNNEKVMMFKKIIENAGITCTVRRELGSDIEAACGQLRRKYLKEG